MRQARHTFEIRTRGRGLHEITQSIDAWLNQEQAQDGLFTAFIQHTSASLLVQENADPDVHADLERFFAKLVQDGDPSFVHRAEGPDDMPAHIRAALTQTHLVIPVLDRKLALGRWQSVYLYEHRLAPRVRRVLFHYAGT